MEGQLGKSGYWMTQQSNVEAELIYLAAFMVT